MQTPSWTEEHARLIAEAAPAVPEASELEVARTWARIRPGLSSAAGSRRRKVRVAIGAGITAATLAVGGVAAADVFHAYTGTYPTDAEDVRLGGPGELLDPGAGDFAEAVEQATNDIPFPDAQSRVLVVQNLAADGARDDPGTSRVSTGAVRAWAAQGAVCAWANQWAAATQSGDDAARGRAVEALEAAPNWPAVTDIDPVQKHGSEKIAVRDEKTGKVSAGTVDDSSQFAYLSEVGAAALGTDVERMDTVLENVWCYGAPTDHLPLTHHS